MKWLAVVRGQILTYISGQLIVIMADIVNTTTHYWHAVSVDERRSCCSGHLQQDGGFFFYVPCVDVNKVVGFACMF